MFGFCFQNGKSQYYEKGLVLVNFIADSTSVISLHRFFVVMKNYFANILLSERGHFIYVSTCLDIVYQTNHNSIDCKFFLFSCLETVGTLSNINMFVCLYCEIVFYDKRKKNQNQTRLNEVKTMKIYEDDGKIIYK